MSLVVWLPLNGNLENRGLSGLTFSLLENGSFTSTNRQGKTGICYNNASLAYGGVISNTTIELGQKQSMFCWFRFTSLSSASTLGGGLVSQHRYPSNSGMGITIRYQSSTTGYLSVNTGTGDSRTYNTYYGTTLLQANTWYHGGYTYDGENIRIYVNGVCEKTQALTGMYVPADYITAFCWSMATGSAVCSGYYHLNGALNDVRVYDHCLSPMEVHELALGKFMHLKLDDPYIESTSNIATANLSNSCYNGATNKYSYGTTTDMYKDDGFYQGKNCTRVRMGTNGLDAYPYVYFDDFTATGTDFCTLSFDYFPTIKQTLVPYSYNGYYNWTWHTDEDVGSATNSGSVVITGLKLFQWNHISIIIERYDHTTTRGTGYIRIGDAKHTSNTLNYWLFANVQVERKDHETGYAPLNTSRTATNIYDVSGCRYDATPNALTVTTDTPLYSHAVVFNGTSSYAKVESTDWMADALNALTVNMWAKTSNWDVSNTRLFSCTESGGFQVGRWSASTGYYTFPVHVYTDSGHTSSAYIYSSTALAISSLPTDEWVMLSFVYTTSGLKIYINGVLHSEYNTTSYGIHYYTSARMFIGCEAYGASPTTPYFNGKISDFRMYATALSVDDIQRLYKSKGYVDNTGNIYAGEFLER